MSVQAEPVRVVNGQAFRLASRAKMRRALELRFAYRSRSLSLGLSRLWAWTACSEEAPARLG